MKSKEHKACVLTISLCAAMMSFAITGQPIPGQIESWDADMAGWIDRDAGEMQVSYSGFGYPGGSLKGEFFPPIAPNVDAFRAEAGSSSGAFTGNYRSQFSRIAGWAFDFYAADILPSSVTVRFGNPGTNFFQGVTGQISSTGAWHRVSVSLESSAGWSGPLTVFSNTLYNVEFVEIQVTWNGQDNQVYYLDNFELVSLDPYIERFNEQGPSLAMMMSELRAGAEYLIESSAVITGEWSEAGSFAATNASTSWTFTPTNEPVRFYRLILPDPTL